MDNQESKKDINRTPEVCIRLLLLISLRANLCDEMIDSKRLPPLFAYLTGYDEETVYRCLLQGKELSDSDEIHFLNKLLKAMRTDICLDCSDSFPVKFNFFSPSMISFRRSMKGVAHVLANIFKAADITKNADKTKMSDLISYLTTYSSKRIRIDYFSKQEPLTTWQDDELIMANEMLNDLNWDISLGLDKKLDSDPLKTEQAFFALEYAYLQAGFYDNDPVHKKRMLSACKAFAEGIPSFIAWAKKERYKRRLAGVTRKDK